MSGQVWLLDLPDACRSGGLEVSTFDGWETRSRSSGGYDDLLGVCYHHDASSSSSDDGSSDAYGWLYADDKPIGAMRLHRSGALVVGAAGATNTQGKGGPLSCSGGTVPLDRGNQTMIAIEAANNGVGEAWPQVQLDAYIALVAALVDWYGLDHTRDVHSHASYCQPSCPGRKIDAAGPTPAYPELGGTSGARTWGVDDFRDLVGKRLEQPGPTPPTPTPSEDDDHMLYISRLDSNPNLIVVGDGISSRRIRADDLDELTAALKNGTGPIYHDPTKADRPIVRDVNKLPKMSDDWQQVLGVETTESLNQPG